MFNVLLELGHGLEELGAKGELEAVGRGALEGEAVVHLEAADVPQPADQPQAEGGGQGRMPQEADSRRPALGSQEPLHPQGAAEEGVLGEQRRGGGQGEEEVEGRGVGDGVGGGPAGGAEQGQLLGQEVGGGEAEVAPAVGRNLGRGNQQEQQLI